MTLDSVIHDLKTTQHMPKCYRESMLKIAQELKLFRRLFEDGANEDILIRLLKFRRHDAFDVPVDGPGEITEVRA